MFIVKHIDGPNGNMKPATDNMVIPVGVVTAAILQTIARADRRRPAALLDG